MAASRIGLLSLAAVGCLSAAASAQPETPESFEKLEAGADAGELRKLLVERYNVAVDEFSLRAESIFAGNLDALQTSLSRVRDSGLEARGEPAERVAHLENVVRWAKRIEHLTRDLQNVGRVALQDLTSATYERADAEIRLLRAKQELAELKDRR